MQLSEEHLRGGTEMHALRMRDWMAERPGMPEPEPDGADEVTRRIRSDTTANAQVDPDRTGPVRGRSHSAGMEPS